jgi:hypothetical protein
LSHDFLAFLSKTPSPLSLAPAFDGGVVWLPLVDPVAGDCGDSPSFPPTWGLPIEIDTLEYQQTEKIETELKDVDRIRTGVRSFVQGLLLGHPIHTIPYTIPSLPTAPPQEKKLPDGEFWTG